MHFWDGWPYDLLRGPIIVKKDNSASERPADKDEREGISKAESEAPLE
jgi:hypothetical protein